MILFTVGREKRTGDGVFAAECPPGITELRGKGSFHCHGNSCFAAKALWVNPQGCLQYCSMLGAHLFVKNGPNQKKKGGEGFGKAIQHTYRD